MQTNKDEGAPTGAHGTPEAETIAETTRPYRTRNRDMTRQIAGWQLLISGASSDQTIQTLMGRYAFGPERITQEGAGLLAEVRQCVHEQAAAAGRQRSAQDERDRVCKELQNQYSSHKTLARLALRGDSGALDQLGVQGPLKSKMADRLAQARQFYSLALGDPAIQMRLAAFSLTLDKLEGGLGLVAQVDHCLMVKSSTRNAAKAATRRRDEAMERMEDWVAEFRTLARLALRDHPELLGTLGL